MTTSSTGAVAAEGNPESLRTREDEGCVGRVWFLFASICLLSSVTARCNHEISMLCGQDFSYRMRSITYNLYKALVPFSPKHVFNVNIMPYSRCFCTRMGSSKRVCYQPAE
ncbi:unnamed protein product [Musa acuminata subsp. burmannicoides]